MTQPGESDFDAARLAEPILSDLAAWGLIAKTPGVEEADITLTGRGLVAWRCLTPLVTNLLRAMQEDDDDA